MQEQVYGLDFLGHQSLGQPEDIQHQELQFSVGFGSFLIKDFRRYSKVK